MRDDVSFNQPVHTDEPRELTEDELLAAEELRPDVFYDALVQGAKDGLDPAYAIVLKSIRMKYHTEFANTAFEMRRDK